MTAAFLRMEDLDLAGRRVLVREDLNVPLRDGAVASAARIDAAVPTLRRCLDAGAAVIVMSHLGRPSRRRVRPRPVAALLWRRRSLTRSASRWRWRASGRPASMSPRAMSRCWKTCAFSTAKRTTARSCRSNTRPSPTSSSWTPSPRRTGRRRPRTGSPALRRWPAPGPLLAAELDALERALAAPARPLVAVVGGAKVSTKLAVLESLAEKSRHPDRPAAGSPIPSCSPRDTPSARRLRSRSWRTLRPALPNAVSVPMPVDVMTASSPDAPEAELKRSAGEVRPDEMILDIGPESARRCRETILDAGTVLWNGPLGVFEVDHFGEGTRVVAEAVAQSSGLLHRRRRRHAGRGGEARRCREAFPTSPRAAARSWSTSRASRCQRSRSSRNGRAA